MTLKHVVLPAPFGPIRPRISPLYRLKLTSLSATTPPNRSVTWSTSSSTSRPVGCDMRRHLLLTVLQLTRPPPARDQALRAQQHDQDQRQPVPRLDVDQAEDVVVRRGGALRTGDRRDTRRATGPAGGVADDDAD